MKKWAQKFAEGCRRAAEGFDELANETTPPPVNNPPTGSVTILGTPVVGQELRAVNNLADADGLGEISYVWSTGGVGDTYFVASDDVGKTISVSASYVDGRGNFESVDSPTVGPIVDTGNNPATGEPGIFVGGNSVGDTLLGHQGTIADQDGVGDLSWQWQRNGSSIAGATNAAYVIQTADKGTNLSVVATFIDGAGNSERLVSQNVSIPGDGPPPPPGGKSRIAMNITWPVPWDTSRPFSNQLKHTEFKNGGATHWIRQEFNINPSGKYIVRMGGASQINFRGQTTGWSATVNSDSEITIPNGEEYWVDFQPANAKPEVIIKGTENDGRIAKSYYEQLRGFRYARNLPFQNMNNIEGVIPFESLGQYVNSVAKFGASHRDFIEVCNAAGVTPWVCVPHILNDQQQRELAALYRDHLKPELFPIIVEFSNECWNFGQAFRHQQDHCEAVGAGFTNANVPPDLQNESFIRSISGFTAVGYGLESERTFKNFEAILGNDRVRNVSAWQLGGSWTTRLVLWNAPSTEAYAMAPYFAWSHSPGGDIDQQISSIRANLINEPGALIDKTLRNLAMDGNDNLPILAYECGHHIIGAQEALNALVDSPQMGQLYEEYAQFLFDKGFETLCFLGYVGRHRKNTAFAHVQNQSPAEFGKPRWQSLRKLIAETSQPGLRRAIKVRRQAVVRDIYDPGELMEIRPSASALISEE